MTGVHQVLAGAAPRDAITNHAIAARDVLRAAGWESEIFADPVHTSAELSEVVKPYSDWPTQPRGTEAAILHFSIDSPAFPWVTERAARTALQYHNVTPPELLWRFNPPLAEQCREGRHQLAELVPRMRAWAAVSSFNARELRGLGAPEVHVTGILRSPRPSLPRDSAGSRPRILFVGRGAPNKAQHDLILAVAALKQSGRAVELRLVGSWGGNRAYLEHCTRLTRRLGLSEDVRVLGSIPDDALSDEYQRADLFLCLSDHEGYCVPLMEALEAGVPVVAYAAGAVPETIGAAGIQLSRKSPGIVAEAVKAVLDGQLSIDPDAVRRQLESHSARAVAERTVGLARELTR